MTRYGGWCSESSGLGVTARLGMCIYSKRVALTRYWKNAPDKSGANGAKGPQG